MPSLHPPRSASLQAICLMLLSMLTFSAMNTAIRSLAGTIPSSELVFLRNVFSLLLAVLWQAALMRGLPRFKTTRLFGHFWRATAGICAMEAWFYALTLLPLTVATALSFTTPVFSTIVAILFLGEKAGIRRWSAIAASFVGMLIILRPGTDSMSPDAAFVIFSSIMMAIAGNMVKSLTRTESPETIVFFMALFMVPWSALPGIFPGGSPWQEVPFHQLSIVFLVAFLSTASHLLLARAYRRADMVMLMPFDFTRLIFTAIFAYLLFGETLDGPTIFGSLIIVASTVYIAHREARATRLLGQSEPVSAAAKAVPGEI